MGTAGAAENEPLISFENVENVLLKRSSFVVETEVASSRAVEGNVGADPGLVVVGIGVDKVTVYSAQIEPAEARMSRRRQRVADDFRKRRAEVRR
jgi:hypothetical protein